MTDVRAILARGVGDASPPPEPFERMLRRRDRRLRRQRVSAGAVGIAVFVSAVWIVASGAATDDGRTPGDGTGPSPTVASGDFVGLPLPGAEPSTPMPGRLVLHVGGGDADDRWFDLHVFEDGRAIWGYTGAGSLPTGAPFEGRTGFVEQRLTPSGIEFLRTQVISTGLFEDDLTLLRGPDEPGFLTIEVRNGDRLVGLTWAMNEALHQKDAPPATPEQARALGSVTALLAEPGSWPAGAWEDAVPETYVPSRYQVWLRALPGQDPGLPTTVGRREVELLPASAKDVLLGGAKVRDATYELTTDETRALVEALDEAGLTPMWMNGEPVLRYGLADPYEPGASLLLFFGPVLPHGEAVFLGPG